MHELEGILSDDLRKELDDVTLPFTSDTPERRRAAHRAGPARRLARRPLPRHPGDAVHPADAGAAAVRGDAPAPRARAGPTVRPARTCEHPRMTAPQSLPNLEWEPTSWQRYPAAQQPVVARRRRARRRARRAARACRRSCSRARRARCATRSRASPRATASCCTRATAPSRSPTSRPTTSATSSRSSSRCRSCSPTAPACRR